MNRKGFTLVELLAVLVALGLVLGIGTFSVSNIIKRTKAKSEEVFVETIKDAMDIYISGQDKPTSFTSDCTKIVKKEDGTEYKLRYHMVDKTLEDVVNSRYKPIKVGQLVNPANNKKCFEDGKLNKINITIYRESLVLNDKGTADTTDDDLSTSAYFYRIDKNQDSFMGCFEHTISATASDPINYISNLESPEKDNICLS